MDDRRRKSQINFYYNRCIQISHFNNNRHSDCCRFSLCCVQRFYTNYQRDRHSVAIFWGRILYILDYMCSTTRYKAAIVVGLVYLQPMSLKSRVCIPIDIIYTMIRVDKTDNLRVFAYQHVCQLECKTLDRDYLGSKQIQYM